MIVETVTTTINPDGSVNCAAMGVEWGEATIVIKPYRATRTLRNLERHGAAVVHVTDDILLFTEAALDDPHPPTRPAEAVDGAVLADACSWREVAVDEIEASGPRARVTTRVVGSIPTTVAVTAMVSWITPPGFSPRGARAALVSSTRTGSLPGGPSATTSPTL